MNSNAPCRRLVIGRVAWRIAGLLALACAAVPALADIPPDAFTNEKLTAADTQRLLYDELVRKGVSREVAALATMDTQVVRNEPDHLQFVQTMIGGIRREVDIRLTPGAARDAKRVPMTLDDGSVALAERVATRRTDNGLSTSGTAYLPKARPTAALLEQRKRQRESPWWLDLFGVGTANAQGGAVGMAISYGDSIASSAGNGVAGQNLTVQGVVDAVQKALSDPGVKDVQTVADVTQSIIDAMQGPAPAVEGPKTLWQTRAETAGSVGKVLKYGYKAYKIYDKDAARRAKLKALEDCAKNPTNPLAKRAQRDDPNYRRATTDAIADAERNLTLNTALNLATAIGNTVAGEMLKKSSPGGPGATMAQGVSYLGQLEGKLLDHVADEYIMKNAGKGVVPCEPDCGPVYSPEPPAPELASYTPAEWSGTSSSGGLVCEAAAPSSSSAQNFTPGPPRPNPASQACGALTNAAVTYRYQQQSSGCGTNFCESRSEEAQFSGAVRLDVRSTPGQEGYVGSGTGPYSGSMSFDVTSPLSCSSKTERATILGSADLVVNVMKSIDNNVVGGIDTGAMPADTSVVEVAFETHDLHQDNYSKNGCDPPNSWSSDDASAGLGCYFYGVDLYRPGFYTVYVNNEPTSGTCTLRLGK